MLLDSVIDEIEEANSTQGIVNFRSNLSTVVARTVETGKINRWYA